MLRLLADNRLTFIKQSECALAQPTTHHSIVFKHEKIFLEDLGRTQTIARLCNTLITMWQSRAWDAADLISSATLETSNGRQRPQLQPVARLRLCSKSGRTLRLTTAALIGGRVCWAAALPNQAFSLIGQRLFGLGSKPDWVPSCGRQQPDQARSSHRRHTSARCCSSYLAGAAYPSCAIIGLQLKVGGRHVNDPAGRA
jgi:hypothetical protein